MSYFFGLLIFLFCICCLLMVIFALAEMIWNAIKRLNKIIQRVIESLIKLKRTRVKDWKKIKPFDFIFRNITEPGEFKNDNVKANKEKILTESCEIDAKKAEEKRLIMIREEKIKKRIDLRKISELKT